MIPALLVLLTQEAAFQASETPLPETLVWADADGDGRLDLAAIRAGGSVQLLLNAGAGRFEDATERFGLSEVANAALLAWADYDADGRLDVFVGAREGSSRLYHNEGGSFVDMSAGSGLVSAGPVRGAYWLDHDGDTRLDLVVLTVEGSELFRGLEGGFFEPVRLPLQALAAASGEERLAGDLLASPAVVIADATRGGAQSDAPGLGDGPAHGSPLGGGLSPRDPAHLGGISVAPSPGLGGSQGVVLFPASCAATLKDQANPGSCLLASTTPTLGELYPLSTNLFVSLAGNVGVGTITPSQKLDVVGNAKASGTVTALQGIFGTSSIASGTNSTVSGGELNSALGGWSFAAGRRAKANHLGSFVWGDSVSIDKTSSATDQFNIYAESGARVFAVGQTTPSLVVDPAGKLGLGTSSPLAVLDILGGADAGGANDPTALALQHRSGGFRHFIRSRHNSASGDAGNGLDFFLNDSLSPSGSSTPGTGNVNCMTLNATLGNRLQVTGGIAVDTNEIADGTYTGPMLRFGPAGSGEGVLSKRTPGGNQFGLDVLTGFQSRVSVTNGGNVGIGTASPTAKLEVAGTTRMTDTLTLAPSGDVALDVSSGNIYKAGVLFIHANSLSSIAMGEGALTNATPGLGEVGNTAIGKNALKNNTSGHVNTALGIAAGYNLTTGSYNVSIASPGVAGESNTTRIGNFQTRAFIKGIRGVTTGVADAIPVLIDSAGQLGTVSSSRRFKEDIHDMGDTTERLLELRPVTFRYKPEVQKGERPIEYGLIAEEVAEVFPDLVVYDEEGKPFTVKYHLMSSMLLNEMKKLKQEVEQQLRQLEEQQTTNDALKERVTRLEAMELEMATLKATLQGLLKAR